MGKGKGIPPSGQLWIRPWLCLHAKKIVVGSLLGQRFANDVKKRDANVGPMGGLSFANTTPTIHQQILVDGPTIPSSLAQRWPNEVLLIGIVPANAYQCIKFQLPSSFGFGDIDQKLVLK